MNTGQIFHKIRPIHRTNKTISSLAVIVVVIIGLFTAGSISGTQSEKPKDAVGYYTKNGQTVWVVPGANIDVTVGGNLTLSQLEALYPMSPDDEAKIVHEIPPCPIIIDGVKYKPEDISLFNGKRLHFITGKDGNLFAFTTIEGLEQFQLENRPSILLINEYSIFYTDIWYSGLAFGILPGFGYPVLAQIGYDNVISSVKATPLASWSYICDLPYYQGDSFAMAGGSNYSMLYFQGWNDRASSAYVTSY